MNIQYIAITDIKPATYNPRKDLKPGDPEYDRLKKAVTAFGMVEPLVWNKRTGNLVGGHQRFKILHERGDQTVPVSIVDLDDDNERILNLALNRHSGEWNIPALADLIQQLNVRPLDMDLTGFDPAELEKLVVWTPPNPGLTDEDSVLDVPVDPITQTGELWNLGAHRLICGDATMSQTVTELLTGVVPHLMIADAPYGINYDADWRNRADRVNGKPYGARAVGRVLNDDQCDWREAWALFPGDVAYLWHAGNKADEVAASIKSVGFEIRAQIIWAKNQLVISRGHYHGMHEPCWYAVRKGKSGSWAGDRKQTTLWQIDKPVKSETGHSTQKPVECMRRPMLNNSNPGQAVYDPFLGSGTTIIAAESCGRFCFAVEINPAYVDLSVRRWQEFTGLQATLQGDGSTFEEIAIRRGKGPHAKS